MSWRIATLLGALACYAVWTDDVTPSVPFPQEASILEPSNATIRPAPVSAPPTAAPPTAAPPAALRPSWARPSSPRPSSPRPSLALPSDSEPAHVDLDRNTPAPQIQAPVLVILRLRHANAAELYTILQGVTDPKELDAVQHTVDARTNSIILRGSTQKIEALKLLIDNLDIEAPRPQKSVAPTVGSPGYVSSPLYANTAPAIIGPQAQVTTRFEPIVALPNRHLAEYARLEGESMAVAQAYHEGKKTLGDNHPQQQERRTELTKLLQSAFDLRQKMQASELKQLKDRMAKVEHAIAARSQNREAIVEKRMQQLLLEGNELNWNPDQTVSDFSRGSPFTSIIPRLVQSPNGQVVTVFEPNASPTLPAGSTNAVDPRQASSPTAPNKPSWTQPSQPRAQPRAQPVPPTIAGDLTSPNPLTTPNPPRNLSEFPAGAGQRRAYLEAKAFMQQKEARVAALKSRLKPDEVGASAEYEIAVRESRNAKSQFEALKRELNAQESLLRLDLEAAESEFEAAKEEHDLKSAKVKNGVAPTDELPRLLGAVNQAKVRIQRVKILLELHQAAMAEAADSVEPPIKTEAPTRVVPQPD